MRILKQFAKKVTFTALFVKLTHVARPMSPTHVILSLSKDEGA